VCGFVRGSVAMIADGSGRFDVFIVGSTNVISGSLFPARPLDQSYAAGATVIEVEAYEFRLEAQGDGSKTLVRETAAGAIQPLVDRVSELRFGPAFGDNGIEIALTLESHRAPAWTTTRRTVVVARNWR
jgi:hypothetical protein